MATPVEVGAKHGGLASFNNVDGYLESMFRGFRIDILRPEDYQAMTQQSETLDGELTRAQVGAVISLGCGSLAPARASDRAGAGAPPLPHGCGARRQRR